MSSKIASTRGAGLPLPSFRPHGMQIHSRMHSTRRSVPLPPRSSSNNGDQADYSADEIIQKLLSENPEAQEQVERVSDAARRVAELQMEQARLARALADAQSSDAASAELKERLAMEAASNLIADAELRAAQLLLKAAELEAESADALRESAAAQGEIEGERLETAKAGTAAAAGGAASILPLVIATSPTTLGGLLTLGGAAASAFLFGLVYRYALRQDLANIQLKGGVVAAFGLVRGIGQASEMLDKATDGLSTLPSVEALAIAAAAMGESMLLFAFASVALEFAFQKGIVKTFKN